MANQVITTNINEATPQERRLAGRLFRASKKHPKTAKITDVTMDDYDNFSVQWRSKRKWGTENIANPNSTYVPIITTIPQYLEKKDLAAVFRRLADLLESKL